MPDLFHQRTIQRLNYSRQESKKKNQSAVYDSDTVVTLKQGQVHYTWYELVDPRKHTNSNNVESQQLKFLPNQETSIISLEYVQK